MAKRKTVKAVIKMSDEEIIAAGFDVGGYRQGEDVSLKYQAAVAAGSEVEEPTNPFEPDSNIGQSWQAGYDAATPDVPVP